MAAQVVKTAVAPFCRRRQFLHFLSPQTTTTTATTVSAFPDRLSLLTLPSHYRRNAHFRARGLRLAREPDPPETARNHGLIDREREETAEEENKRRNRSQMKRDARQAVRWGMDLASFPTPQIKRILKAASLQQEVFEALMLVKRLGPDVREGKRRQFNYIGKLLRDAQADLLGALIQATKDGDQSRFQAIVGSVEAIDEVAEEEFHESESEEEVEEHTEHLVLASKWYDGLVNKDIEISNDVYSVNDVEFDRQELRRLVRKVHNVQDRQNSNEEDTSAEMTAAKKKLNRFLCSLAKRVSVSNTQSLMI